VVGQGADLILVNGSVWTAGAAPAEAQALALAGTRILGVGSTQEMRELSRSDTAVLDLEGRSVLPGFIDSHVHFTSGGFKLSSVQLRDADTPEEFVDRIRHYATEHPGTSWITGGDWDHEAWGGELPHRDWIDPVTADHPVFVNRLDAHMALANSAALDRARVTSSTQEPPGGTIVRDERGRLTGVLKDEAMRLVSEALPAPADADVDLAVRAAAQHALSLGVTQVHDMGSWGDLEAYRRVHSRGELPIRIYSVVPMASWKRLRDYIEEHGRGDDRVWWGGVKAFVDGSLGSTTAWFYEPYLDDPSTSGLLLTESHELRQWILDADEAGLQPIVHAIGDRANDWLLDVFAEACARAPERPRRPRIEHAQHLRRETIPRFAQLGVIASMQPYHAADDGRWAERRIGAERMRTTYALRSLLDAGATLALGSDWTVAPLDPLTGLDAALTRRTVDGANPDGWVPEQRIGLREALRGYTSAAAWAGCCDDRVGVIKPGYEADLVVLSEDILEVDPNAIGALHVDMTIVAGEIVFRRDGEVAPEVGAATQ
jgi:predicted amidohydrolase YtcJ